MNTDVYKAIYEHLADSPEQGKAIIQLLHFLIELYHDYESNTFPKKVQHD